MHLNKTKANGMLVLVTIVWGGGFIATSGALESLSPFTIMMIRFLGAAIFPIIISWKELKRLNSSELMHGIVAGIFLFLAFAFQTFGLQETTASKNAFLTASNVVFVPYLLWMLMKRKPSHKEIIASAICIIGIALLTLDGSSFALNTGDLLTLICAIFFALHIITLERSAAHINAFALTALQMITAGIISAVCVLLFDKLPITIHMDATLNLLYLIFMSTMLAYLLQTYAQKYTSANSASLILSMEALFASIFSFIFLNETLSFSMIIGACLIFLSIIYIEYKPKRKST